MKCPYSEDTTKRGSGGGGEKEGDFMDNFMM
jgi:hypothetical protein